MIQDQVTKKCTKCQEVKPILMFDFRSDTHKYRNVCKTCRLISSSVYYQNNRIICDIKNKHYILQHPEIRKRITKKYRITHADVISQNQKQYQVNNKEKRRIYQNYKIKTDFNYRLRSQYRTRINNAIKGKCKYHSSIDLLGCTINELKQYLEKQFTEGMTWNNYGKYGWHIDHIIPCAIFDMSDPIEQKQCFHYTNLQPLWATDNLKKGTKYIN